MSEPSDSPLQPPSRSVRVASRWHRAAPWIFTLAIVVATAGAVYWGVVNRPSSSQSQILARDFPEPSGIVFHPTRKTLFVVGDEGHVGEMTTDGRFIRKRHIAGANFEGVTVHPSTGHLYALIERENRVEDIEPDSLRIVRSFAIEGQIGGRTILPPGAEGLEGIAFVPDDSHPEGGRFFVINRGPVAKEGRAEPGCSFIAEVAIPLKSATGPRATAPLVNCTPCGEGDLSDLTWVGQSRRLIAISDGSNTCIEIDDRGRVQRRGGLPGKAQEGIAFDDAGFAYIAQDSGGILKFQAPHRWRSP